MFVQYLSSLDTVSGKELIKLGETEKLKQLKKSSLRNGWIKTEKTKRSVTQGIVGQKVGIFSTWSYRIIIIKENLHLGMDGSLKIE